MSALKFKETAQHARIGRDLAYLDAYGERALRVVDIFADAAETVGEKSVAATLSLACEYLTELLKVT